MHIGKPVTTSLSWVGIQDPKLRIFDIVMETKFGTTYNSYLLKASEKTALFETCKDKFTTEYIDNLQKTFDISTLDYIIINHTEPDHTGALYKLIELAPNATIVGSFLAIKYLSSILNIDFNSKVVKDGDCICLGDKTIDFITVPCLHWPDTMYSYIREDQTLITCDSFGAHYASDHIFYNELDTKQKDDYFEAFNYYYSMIMGPFKPFVLKALKRIENLEIKTICPSHGLVLNGDAIQTFITYYKEWSTPSPKTGCTILIPYVSAYGYTAQLATSISEGIAEALPNADISLYDLSYANMDEVIAQAANCDGLLLGSPTLLADTLPQIWQILTSLNPIIHGGKTAACFGSFGWSSEGTKFIMERYNQLKFKTPLEPFTVCFKPTSCDLENAKQFGHNFGKLFL
ncbi:MAG: FprA family A-type flavoprotein [Cellulosilyticaceae bacterium]